jgi:hypothetical protein
VLQFRRVVPFWGEREGGGKGRQIDRGDEKGDGGPRLADYLVVRTYYSTGGFRAERPHARKALCVEVIDATVIIMLLLMMMMMMLS